MKHAMNGSKKEKVMGGKKMTSKTKKKTSKKKMGY